MATKESIDYVFKIIVIGNSSVGKTSLTLCFARNEKVVIGVNRKATIGADFCNKALTIGDHRISLFIWDTAGQEKYANVVNTFYRGAGGIIICFALNNRESFDNVPNYLENVEEYANKSKIIIVGTKSDCQRTVSQKDIDEICSLHNLKYFETSSVSASGVKELFTQLATDIIGDKTTIIQQRHYVKKIGGSSKLNKKIVKLGKTTPKSYPHIVRPIGLQQVEDEHGHITTITSSIEQLEDIHTNEPIEQLEEEKSECCIIL